MKVAYFAVMSYTIRYRFMPKSGILNFVKTLSKLGSLDEKCFVIALNPALNFFPRTLAHPMW
jgi:hypothetical protein